MDYSQLEIRVAAQMSGDKDLITILQSGEDLHATVGHELTGRPVEQIKKDRDTRTAIKGFHFGIIYGKVPETLYYSLKASAKAKGEKFPFSMEDVKKMHKRYFERFSGMKKYLDEQVALAEENGYVTTIFGFQREISMFGDEDRGTYWKNQALNSGIQGSAHQLLLTALSLLEAKKEKYDKLQRLSMEIHDAVYGFVKVKELPEIFTQAKALLEKEVIHYVEKHWPEIKWKVPLLAEGKAGFRLGVMTKYAGEPPEEFLQQWCRDNQLFEIELKKNIKKAKLGDANVVER